MTAPPTTRNSLILRLRDRRDAHSWQEFVALYEPVIYRVAKRRGLQHADASEIVQRVFLAVVRAVDRFEPDPERGRFRSWLYRITYNEFCKALPSSTAPQASGDSAVLARLSQHPAPHQDDAFETEYRWAVLRWAADQVRPQVEERTWQAFWRTASLGQPPQVVASELGISVGAVYVAKSRVMARLQRAVGQYEEAE